MSFRARVAVTAALAVTVAIVLAFGGAYLASARTLLSQVDRSLEEAARPLVRAAAERRVPRPGPLNLQRLFGGDGGFARVIDASGTVRGGLDADTVPVTSGAAQVAGGTRPGLESVTTDQGRIRTLTIPVRDGLALQVVRSLDEVDRVLAVLRRRFILTALAGAALAAGLGTLVAMRVVGPVRRLTESAEHVAATQDLSHRIHVEGSDEIARLAATFNGMLANLDQARNAQRQLVADASHELRTPLTSLRTNIEVLADGGGRELDAADRGRLLADVVLQLGEFGRLVDGLVELARGEQPVAVPTAVRLDELVEDAVSRAQTYAPDVRFEVETRPTVVSGAVDRIDRAVANLLDNAVKYGEGAPIEVRVGDGRVEVRDHGPGIDPGDLPHVFDRFYRAPSARARPGSGLGLSIVRQVAEAHGGSAVIGPAGDGGGTRAELSLPVRG